MNVDLSEIRNWSSKYDNNHHLHKIQKIVEGLQDEIVRNEKLEKLEESQRLK